MEPTRHLKLQIPGLRVDLVIERETPEGWENQGICVFNKDFREIFFFQRNFKIKRFICFRTQIDLGPRLTLGQSGNNHKLPVKKTKAEGTELMVHPAQEATY